MRFQVRKRDKRWEVWVFQGRSWALYDHFFSYKWAMALVTGQSPYGPDLLGHRLIAISK